MAEDRLLLRLEATSSKLIKELQKAEVETRRRVKGIDDAFTQSNRRVTDGLARAGAAYRQGTQDTGRFGSAVQNAGFQVQDMAVQIAGGTSATRALSQQLPQLLSGLGLAGVLMGTVAAIAIPLGANFFSAGEQMKAIDAISLDQVRSRVQELTDLQAKYADAVRISAFSQDEASLQAVTAIDREYQAKLTLFRLEAITLEQRKRQLEAGIASQRALIEEMANDLRILFNDPDAGQAEFVRTRAMSEQLAVIQGMIEGNEALFLEIQRQNAELDLVNLSLADAQALLGGAVSLAKALAGGLGGAAGEALTLAQNLAQASRNYGKIMNRGDSGPDAARREVQELNANPITGTLATGAGGVKVIPKSPGGGGGRRGGGASADPQAFLQQRLDLAQAAAEAARVEAASILLGAQAATRAKVQIEMLNEAKRRNLDLDRVSTLSGKTLRQEIDAQADAIAKLTVEADQYREQAQFLNSVQKELKDGFLDAILEGKSFSGVLKDVARQLARAALEAALFNSGPFAGLRGGGGGLKGLFKGFLSIFGGARAAGGPVSSGKAYLVGEKGPEIFAPQRAGTIIPNGAGGRTVQSVVEITLGPGLVANILSVAQNDSVRIAAAASRAQTRALPSALQSYEQRGTI